MSPKGRLAKWVSENMVMIVVVPLIIGVHYAWYKIQDVPYLVDQSKKKEFPLIGAYNSISRELAKKFNNLSGNSNTTEPQKEQEN